MQQEIGSNQAQQKIWMINQYFKNNNKDNDKEKHLLIYF